MMDLPFLISPIAPGTFLADHWQQKPFSVSRGDLSYYDQVLTLDEIDGVLTDAPLTYPAIQIVHDGEHVSPDAFSDDFQYGFQQMRQVIDPERVINLFSHGATVVFNALHRSWRPLSELVSNIHREFRYVVHANAYLTPRDATGFAAHYDIHDVFILQISGKKHWQIYDPMILDPLSTDIYDLPSDLGEADYNVDLSAGDLIYLPRGYIHSASTSSDLSLHVTLGITPFTWIDVLKEVVRVAEKEQAFREAVPVSLLHSSNSVQDHLSRYQQLLDWLGANTHMPIIVDRLRARSILNLTSDCKGQFNALQTLERLDSDSRLSIAPGLTVQVLRYESKVSIVCNGKQIDCPIELLESVKFIAGSTKSFRPKDVPPSTLADDEKLVLVRRLVRKGLLILED